MGGHCVERETAHEFVVKEKGLDSTGSLKQSIPRPCWK